MVFNRKSKEEKEREQALENREKLTESLTVFKKEIAKLRQQAAGCDQLIQDAFAQNLSNQADDIIITKISIQEAANTLNSLYLGIMTQQTTAAAMSKLVPTMKKLAECVSADTALPKSGTLKEVAQNITSATRKVMAQLPDIVDAMRASNIMPNFGDNPDIKNTEQFKAERANQWAKYTASVAGSSVKADESTPTDITNLDDMIKQLGGKK